MLRVSLLLICLAVTAIAYPPAKETPIQNGADKSGKDEINPKPNGGKDPTPALNCHHVIETYRAVEIPVTDCTEFGHYLIYRIDQGKLFAEAEQLCNLMQRGHLVSIHSYNEYNTVRGLMTAYNINEADALSFWIGIHAPAGTPGYGWTDGTPLDYTKWHPGYGADRPQSEERIARTWLHAHGVVAVGTMNNFAGWDDGRPEWNWYCAPICKAPVAGIKH